MPEVKENPDYQLVMKFLELVTPGNMDRQSSNQLMMIGERIANGGSLSDKEREMFQSVVGAMPMEGARDSGEITPMMGAADYDITNPRYEVKGGGELRLQDIMNSQSLTDAEKNMLLEGNKLTDAQKRMAEEEAYFKRLREEQEQMYNMSQQAMQEQMQSAAPMTSPRPMARPMR